MVLGTQEFFGQYTENTAFLKTCRHSHETKQEPQGAQIDIARIFGIRLYSQHGKQGEKERDAENRLLPEYFI